LILNLKVVKGREEEKKRGYKVKYPGSEHLEKIKIWIIKI